MPRLKAILFLTTRRHSYSAGQLGLSTGPRLQNMEESIFPSSQGLSQGHIFYETHAKETGIHSESGQPGLHRERGGKKGQRDLPRAYRKLPDQS